MLQTAYKKIKLERIDPPGVRIRRNQHTDTMPQLTYSVEQNGVLQPVLVVKDKKRYRLIAGERRYNAAKAARLKTIPALVIAAAPQQQLVAALCENLYREPLSFFEQARAFGALLKDKRLSKYKLGQMLGLSEPYIEQKLELLKLNAREIDLASEAGLSERQVRSILRLAKNEREGMIIETAAKGLTEPKLEQRVCEMLNERYVGDGPRTHIAVKDVRIFINTITRAVEVMNEAGLDATVDRQDTERFIEYSIKIPLSPNRPTTARWQTPQTVTGSKNA